MAPTTATTMNGSKLSHQQTTSQHSLLDVVRSGCNTTTTAAAAAAAAAPLPKQLICSKGGGLRRRRSSSSSVDRKVLLRQPVAAKHKYNCGSNNKNHSISLLLLPPAPPLGTSPQAKRGLIGSSRSTMLRRSPLFQETEMIMWKTIGASNETWQQENKDRIQNNNNYNNNYNKYTNTNATMRVRNALLPNLSPQFMDLLAREDFSSIMSFRTINVEDPELTNNNTQKDNNDIDNIINNDNTSDDDASPSTMYRDDPMQTH
ncbi:hypothetical protein IV203_020184 [Nitzschia inconspicua]|uniref:Uncharacterized protein n=1 Tax=Nitzschia inconspicua TaxID=303405 RepID=A0A9K3M050_9STRA|nr:hypothetical protein IV203_020184 [Nitzschia inconspicua]